MIYVRNILTLSSVSYTISEYRYEALGWTLAGNVAVKLFTGEPPASNYLRSELIRELKEAFYQL